MALIKIDYSDIKDAAKRAKDASEYYEDYADDLRKKVYDKLKESDLPESDSAGHISAARSAISNRMTALRKKKDYYSDLSESITKMRDNIESYEGDVVKEVNKIATSGLELDKQTPWDAICQWLYGTFCVDLERFSLLRFTIIGRISDLIKIADWAQETGAKIANWFKRGEGRYILESVLTVLGAVAAIAAAVVAVVTAVASGGVAILVVAAVAAVIGTTLAVVDAVVSVVNDVKARMILRDTGDPGQARFYGNIDDVGELTKRRDFGDEKANKRWETFGKVHDITREVANAVATVAGAIGTAGLTYTKEIDEVTGKLKIRTEFDKKQIKPNLIKGAQEKIGLKKVDGKWKIDLKHLFSPKKKDYGVADKQDLLKKNMILDWKLGRENMKVLKQIGPVNLAVLVETAGAENYIKHIDGLARADYKKLTLLQKYAKLPGKVDKQITNWGDVLGEGKTAAERIKAGFDILESTDIRISGPLGTLDDIDGYKDTIKDIIDLFKKDDGAA